MENILMKLHKLLNSRCKNKIDFSFYPLNEPHAIPNKQLYSVQAVSCVLWLISSLKWQNSARLIKRQTLVFKFNDGKQNRWNSKSYFHISPQLSAKFCQVSKKVIGHFRLYVIQFWICLHSEVINKWRVWF